MNMFSYVAPKTAAQSQILYEDPVLTKLKNKLPTQLTEQYYQCVQTTFQSIITGIGVGKSNADVFGAIAVTIVILIIMQLIQRQGKKIKTKKEKEDDKLAIVEKRQEQITDAIRLLTQATEKSNPDSKLLKDLKKCIENVEKIDENNFDVVWEEIDEDDKPKGFILI